MEDNENWHLSHITKQLLNALSLPLGENRTTLTVLECRFSVERNSTVATVLSFEVVEDFASFTSHSCNITKVL